MHEYGWDLKKVLSHTQYQLRSLANAIAKRTAVRSVSLASIIRSAYGANQTQFQEFIDGLMQLEGSKEETNQEFL